MQSEVPVAYVKSSTRTHADGSQDGRPDADEHRAIKAILADVKSGKVTLRPEDRARLAKSMALLESVVERHRLLSQLLAADAKKSDRARTGEVGGLPERITKASAKTATPKNVGRPRSLDLLTIQRIVSLRESGKTIAAIADQLTREGIPTARGGQAWSTGTIQTVLKSRTARSVSIEHEYAGASRSRRGL
jgi:hypothetical protein